ncbi:MAG: pyrroline-5-carboxylate reductase [Campylobacterales bacterium]|nr:pyrroline-5-carboxylate reductase [Campylobacterales bacterium]
MKLTIIGSGSMATALSIGLQKHYELEVVAKDISKAKLLASKLNKPLDIYPLNNYDITGKTILLCVKPYALDEVAANLKGEATSLISILASTPIKTLFDAINAKHIVRAMPNVSAAFGASTTTLVGSHDLKNEALKIFESIGDAFWLKSEKELDIATAIAGSGPAYLALIAEAMMDGGVKQGLQRDDSMKLVRSLFKGFAPLLANSHPALIKDSVMSPAGTTAAGYAALEECGVRDAFIKAIECAYKVTQKK